MRKKLPTELFEVALEKLVHGGQALGTLEDGRKVFIWNALPGERVRVRIIKQKKSFLESIAEEILEASPERITPAEQNYLSTSPWQMMTYEAENKYKVGIIKELFQHSHINTPTIQSIVVPGKAGPVRFSEAELTSAGPIQGPLLREDSQKGIDNPSGVFHYRNKMEYSFWGDNEGLHLALHQRGSHGKQIVAGSKLAMPAIDAAANAIVAQLNELNVRAGDLKTIIVRTAQNGDTVAALFVKPKEFPELTLPKELKGLRVYHSNPKSPASVPTKLLQEEGSVVLEDALLDKTFKYDVDSFFQVNIPIFEAALKSIASHVSEGSITDMYSGVGSIGLSVARQQVELVELDPASIAMARMNAQRSGLAVEVVEASTEKALAYITYDKPVIFDPPRAGLHQKVVERVLEVMPPKIIYLSCNPATQARDLALLQEKYTITHFEIFNFFPRTPHIETLAVLDRK